MRTFDINNEETFKDLLVQPAFKTALEWLRQMPTDITTGEHNITSRNIYANVQGGAALAPEAGQFETHQNYADIHFCVSGGEIIYYGNPALLKLAMPYDPSKDVALYNWQADQASLSLLPGQAAIFYPGEAHLPKIFDGKNKTLKKVIIKIKIESNGDQP